MPRRTRPPVAKTTEQPVEIGRAVYSEYPASLERAVISEYPDGRERAVGDEYPVEQERAVRAEYPGSTERAVSQEYSADDERAVIREYPGRQERAVVPEYPGETERAALVEYPELSERAVTYESPEKHERAVIREYPVIAERIPPALPEHLPFLMATPLDADLRRAARDLRPNEIRYLIDRYYQSQEDRKRAANQLRAARSDGEPNLVLTWSLQAARGLEDNIRKALAITAPLTVPGQWLLSILGIGPVLTAGWLSYLDITRAPTPSHFWSFCGLNPDAVWEKGAKRPWCAAAKLLAWKTGDSFVKISNSPNDTLYGRIYRERKALEVQRDATGGHATAAAQTLSTRTFKDSQVKARYAEGRLPDGRLDLRARRVAVKLFLAHLHHVLYQCHYRRPPDRPYILETDPRHTHYMPPPNWPLPGSNGHHPARGASHA